MQRRTLIAGLGLVAAAGAGGWIAARSPAAGLPSFGAANAQAVAADTSRVQEMTLGNPDAAVTVVEYASFTCPHCANFHASAFGQLKANYIDTGRINFIYREVYFDRFGLWAGLLARCGGASRYFGIAELLYAKQRDWTAGGDPAQVAANLRTIGRTAGLSDAELDSCLADNELARALVAVYQENAARDGINSTPSFLIDGEKYSNMSYAEFAAILDDKLGG